MTVVDASVAVKWLFPEPGAAQAQALLESGEILQAPALVRTEVAGAVSRKARFGEIEPADAGLALQLWQRILSSSGVAVVPDELDLSRGFAISLALSHPLQDCLYLALAERLQADFVTADGRFESRARTVYGRVRLLAPAAAG
jgi:predicted nucleic acid-binding protein